MNARRIRLAAAALAAAATTAVIAGASPASAAATTRVLAPGQSVCVQEYASYQVRAEGTATGGGARFKLLRNGYVLEATPGRVNWWAAERRTGYGTFPGAGYYAACAYNTGTSNTTVFLNVLADGQFS